MKKEAAMNNITASQLKTEGVAAIEKVLAVDCEAVVMVRGKEKFAVMDMQRYNSLREYELNYALYEIKINYEKGILISECVE
jgi:PHD/YefM family antitoxin component YafN of YafNO toxin-antitoxin module